MSVTLETMRTRVRQRTDNEHTGNEFVTDAELTQLINTAYTELYGLLVRYSIQRSESEYIIAADGSSSYSLPSDFYSLIGVWRTDGQVQTRLTRHGERFRPGSVGGTAVTYRLVGAALVLYPKPSSGTYTVTYIAVPPELSADADTLDGVLGWEELVVLDCAIKVLEKEEADTEALRRDKAALIDRIKQEAQAVEFMEDYVVADTRGRTRQYPDSSLLEGMYLDRRGIRGWSW